VARTRAADYPERREAIVERAAMLFASRGFNGASMADLAAACETSKSLLYHYYPSKEDLLYAVMLGHIDLLVGDVAAVGGSIGQGDAKTRLGRILHAFMGHYVGAANRQKVLLNDLAHLPDNKRASIVAKQRSIIAAVQSLLVQLDPALAADPAAARVRTMLLFGMINWTHTWYDPAGPVSASEIADQALALFS
jgi:AcrR family transcriptional regulator